MEELKFQFALFFCLVFALIWELILYKSISKDN